MSGDLTTEGCTLLTESKDARRLVEEILLVWSDTLRLMKEGLTLADPECTTGAAGGYASSYVYPGYVPSGW